jgi:hypothetical protein
MKKAFAQSVVLGAGAVLGVAIMMSGAPIAAQQGRAGGRGGEAGGRGGEAQGERGRGPAPRPTYYSLNDPAPQDPALKGAIDLHAHLDPDSNGPSYGQAARSLDVLDQAKRAKESGMRGFMIMGEHMDDTGQLAYIVRKLYPGLEVFGGMANNLMVGDKVNPWAVIHMTEMKGGYGRMVELSTWDSEWSYHTVRNYQATLAPMRAKYFKNPYMPIAICKDGSAFWAKYPTPCADGDLLPEVKQVLEIIATRRTRETNGELILETGHSSLAEGTMLIKAALKAGVNTIINSHPRLQGYTPQQVKEAAELGPGHVWEEFTWQFGRPGTSAEDVKWYVDAIRAAGVEHSFVSSDAGQAGTVYPPDALALAARTLRANGFTEHELDQLFKINPAKILGLRPPTLEEMGQGATAK